MTATTTKATKAASTAERPLAVTTEAAPQETDTTPDDAIVPAAETTAISRWEAIAHDIAIAGEQAPIQVFDYRDKWDNKQARSWVHELRQLKGKIERARKDAKAVHLQRGKTVDETAKTLEAAVQGMIEPHETAIKALEAEEQARVDAHRAVLDQIAALAEGGETVTDVDARLAELAAIDTSALEEFAQAGLNRQAEAIERLELLRDTLETQEAQRIELEALRAEKAAREEAERIAQIQREAVEADRLAREAETERQRLATEEQARKDREAVAAREALALAQVEAARQAQAAAQAEAAAATRRALDAEAVADALQGEALLAIKPAELPTIEISDQAVAGVRTVMQGLANCAVPAAPEALVPAARIDAELALQQELHNALAGKTRTEVVQALVHGTLHPAITINWGQVAGGQR